jgi:chromosome segregation ATPase
MGRPPIGKRAMTGAERQQRYVAGLAAKSSGKADGRDAEIERLQAENAKLKARIVNLEAELARAKKEPPPISPDDFSPERKQAVAEERKAKRAAKRAAKKRAAVGLMVEEPETIEGVKAELDKVMTQLASARTRIKNQSGLIHALSVDVGQGKRTQLVMSERLFKEINFHIHEDRAQGEKAKARAHKCLAEFNGLNRKLYKD